MAGGCGRCRWRGLTADGGRCRRASGARTDSGLRDCAGQRNPAPGTQSSALRARSPSLPRPGRAASSRTASFSPLAAVLNACPGGGGARPSLRQRTAPPQTVRAPDTRRHRCSHPSGWRGGGCGGDRRRRRRASGARTDSGSRDCACKRNPAPGLAERCSASPSASAPEPVPASSRSGCVHGGGFARRVVANSIASLRGSRARPSLRQRTAPPQTVRAPDTRRHRCHQPSGWGGGGCSGDRRVNESIVLLDEQRWRRAGLVVRRSEGSTEVVHWPVRGDV